MTRYLLAAGLAALALGYATLRAWLQRRAGAPTTAPRRVRRDGGDRRAARGDGAAELIKFTAPTGAAAGRAG